MPALIIGEAARASIKAALHRAQNNPVPWEMIERAMIAKPSASALADQAVRPDPEYLTLGIYRASVSFEHHTGGLFRHLSVFCIRKGHAFHLEAIKTIAGEYGFQRFPPRSGDGRIWLEACAPGQNAINVIERVDN